MQAHWASAMLNTLMAANMTFNPSLFILNNQELFMTIGVVVAIGTAALVITAVTVMVALRTMK